MKQVNIPTPPDPQTPQYRGNPLAWQRAATEWMQHVKGVTENGFREVAKPCGQQMASPTSFTTNTAVTGTTTGTDLSNVVCSLIAALIQGGVLSPTISREQTQ